MNCPKKYRFVLKKKLKKPKKLANNSRVKRENKVKDKIEAYIIDLFNKI